MLRLMTNKKAFSLIGILVSLCVSFVSFMAVVHAVEVEKKNIERKNIAINRTQTIGNIKKIQSILSQGYLNRNDKVSSGVSISDTGFSIKTTFFSKNYVKTDLYSLKYNSANKTIEERIGATGNFSPVLSNITSCVFVYKDKQGNNTTDISKIVSVTITITYAGNPNNSNNKETFVVKQFLNQNS